MSINKKDFYQIQINITQLLILQPNFPTDIYNEGSESIMRSKMVKFRIKDQRTFTEEFHRQLLCFVREVQCFSKFTILLWDNLNFKAKICFPLPCNCQAVFLPSEEMQTLPLSTFYKLEITYGIAICGLFFFFILRVMIFSFFT